MQGVTQEDQTYNGWKNYPTWCVNLWLSNDEGLSTEAHRIIDILREQDAEIREELPLNLAVADHFENWVTDELAPDLGASFAADLLGFALDQVNWHEIADSWIQSVSEQA